MLAVVLVESGGRMSALSPKGARGLGQSMPDTARSYGLAVTADRDERIEAMKATRAAARYLRDLHQRFGDWRLAFAAYNAGEQAVERAVAKSGFQDFLSGRTCPPGRDTQIRSRCLERHRIARRQPAGSLAGGQIRKITEPIGVVRVNGNCRIAGVLASLPPLHV